MNIANIYNEVIYNDTKPMIKVLFETDFTKEIRIAMHKNTQMKEHKTNYPIVVEIIEGAVDFGVEGIINKLKKGDLVALDGGVPHDLKATEDCLIRLTLTKYDTSERVEEVSNK